MAGKHEPATKRSFYYSLATATLRGILVIAAVVLGVFVLSRAFPTSGEVPIGPEAGPGSPEPEQTVEESPPAETVTPQEDSEACPPAAGIVVQVLNGTDVEGLAARTARQLERQGYSVPEEFVANANRNYDVTTIVFRKDSRLEAECLRDSLFPEAELDRAPAPNQTDPDIQLTVVAGADYAAQLEQSG